MSSKEIKLSNFHCIFFIYHCFAAFSDGKLVESERDAIISLLYSWVEDEDQTKKITQETLQWFNDNVESEKEALEYMSSMIDFLNENESFNIYRKEHFLLDIRNISRADGDFCETEKKWHDIMASQLGVNIRISELSANEVKDRVDMTKRRPIGFQLN